MKANIILILSIFLSLNSIGQLTHEKELIGSGCSKNWQYFRPDYIISGYVIFHKKALAFCGHNIMVSVTLIKTEIDTIRVIELCNVSKDFEVSQKVSVWPSKVPETKVNLPLTIESDNITHIDPEECNIKRTCYGIITLFK